ncbi:M20/M25/M40 family metallo-hydrolase [Brooklawnia cerclae]|uniref:Acetylornithine deacetylase/succinyl-diaminopimelate desuccinylase-like protein n=1 Tax=Brooklawnia cerclae TaxID=349934 RepID=A0ABX0SIU9_9ACTN|nr:acetylornithine deacetylase/succinyl-diaminopimelate desuccinylase-like protein [Brooklawnia cerclae]
MRTLEDLFAGIGLSYEIVEPSPGRASIIARIPGSDNSAPSLGLFGHLDVVPVEAEGWTQDPFGGEIIDGWVWGRGAIDMLGLTASFAVVTRELAERGIPLKGDLVFGGVADEENGSAWGVDWLTSNRWDLVRADSVLTESGGVPVGPGRRRTLGVGEKGGAGRTLRVIGRPAHGSRPWGSQNAIVLAAEAVRRISAYRGPVTISPEWADYVDALGLAGSLRDALLDPLRIDDALPDLGDEAGVAHATTHDTFAPTVVRAGQKQNVIPGEAEVTIDIRVLPGTAPQTVDELLYEAIGDLREHVQIVGDRFGEPTVSPAQTPLTGIIDRTFRERGQGGGILPILHTGGTDARFFRRRGVPAYGFGLFSDVWKPGEFRGLFHGHDERIDIASLGLTASATWDVATRYLADVS